ncbi:MAG TPA: universal stress protein [Coleofasciculaceae cyanobacterium]
MTDITPKPLKILIAVDLSESSHKALTEAYRLVNLSRASLIVLSVEEPIAMPSTAIAPGLMGEDVTFALQQEAEMVKLEQEGVQTALSWAEQVCQQADVPYTLRSEFGDPKQVICDVAKREGCDLIVVGAQTHGFLARLIAGSVSDFVVNHAQCSVLVIH